MTHEYTAELMAYKAETPHKTRSPTTLDASDVDMVCVNFYRGKVAGQYQAPEECVDITLLWHVSPKMVTELLYMVNLRLGEAQEEGRREIRRSLRDLIHAARDEDR